MLNLTIAIISLVLLILAIKNHKYFIAVTYMLYIFFYKIVTRYEIAQIFGAVKPIDVLFIIIIIPILLRSNRRNIVGLNIFLLFLFFNIMEIWIGTIRYGQWGIGEAREYILSSIIFLYIVLMINKKEEVYFIIKVMIITGVVVGILSLIKFFISLIYYREAIRPFMAAQALSVLTSFILLNGFYRSIFRNKYYLILNYIVVLGIIILQHRSVWMAFVVALLLIFYKEKKLKKIIPIFGLIIILFFSTYMLVSQSNYFKIIENTLEYRLTFATSGAEEDASGRFRILAWQAELEKFSHSPFVGSGWGNKKLIHPTRGLMTVHIHNGHITLLSRTGIVGYLLFLFFVFSVLKNLRYSEVFYLNIAVFAMFVYSFFYPFIYPIWIILGLSFVLNQILNRETNLRKIVSTE